MELDQAKGLKLGKTIVIGRSVGIDSRTSQRIVFSEDRVEVNVIPLNAVQIQMPLRRVQSGTILPASVWAAPNISPLITGKGQNNLRYCFEIIQLRYLTNIFLYFFIKMPTQELWMRTLNGILISLIYSA